ncbi:MAG: FixH family protein [Bacteroidota bacterium]
MNWGYKILIVIIVFMVGMLGMVGLAFRQNNEMIDANYYDKEIAYQSLIDASNNLSNISKDSILILNEQEVICNIPVQLNKQFKTGTIEFIKSDDMSKDQTIKFVPDEKGIFIMQKNKFSKGAYKARIHWINESTSYYKEQTIIIK